MLKQFAYKQFGITEIKNHQTIEQQIDSLKEYIKILFLRQHSQIVVDFQEFEIKNDTLFFISPAQIFRILPKPSVEGILLHYNRDFYCIEIHDKEVSCDGILYNNVFETPCVALNEADSIFMKNIFTEIHQEMHHDDIANEEMLRILLKQIIIKATRIWKKQHEMFHTEQQNQVEFLRKFSQLVEQNYTKLHGVAEYAEILHLTPKNLNKKITQLGKSSPNEIIKERIILEAKRLLAHTTRSVKEIAYHLGYEDDAYFVRFFSKQSGVSPQQFRKQYANK